MFYRLIYSNTSEKQIRSLHPWIKPTINKHIEDLKENPFLGKALEKELSGYHALRAKRFRVIYEIKEQEKIVQIHYVGYRKDIYQLFRELLEDKQ